MSGRSSRRSSSRRSSSSGSSSSSSSSSSGMDVSSIGGRTRVVLLDTASPNNPQAVVKV